MDSEVRADNSIIEAAADYFSHTASVQARMASRLIESDGNVTESYEHEAERAVYYASRAVNLMPKNYEYRILLAAARELNGDLAEAETELRRALVLAPKQVNVHWRLGNLFIREGKLDPAINELRYVNEADPSLLTATLNLLWQATDGKIEALRRVVGSDPKSQLTLARFLVEQGQSEVVSEIAKSLDSRTILDFPETGQLLDALISAGQIDQASKLWRSFWGTDDKPRIWNGSFETPIRKDFAQFDWNLGQSKYADIGITTSNAKTEQRSLKIVYRGIDTTKLGSEIRQFVPVRPNAQYTLRCYYRAERLTTPDGPKVAVIAQGFTGLLAASPSLEAGSYDWRLLRLDFVVPSHVRALIISIEQTPQFSYVDPTRGAVWFDDFVLTEQEQLTPTF